MKGLSYRSESHQVAPDTVFYWPGSQKKAVVDYFIHNPLAMGVGGAAEDMLHLLRRNDLALRRAFAGKKQTEYMGGPGSDSAYELLPFGLSAYGRWMRHTQRWVKSLARRAVDARQGRDAFAVSTDYLVGPLLVKLAAGVAVT